MEDFLVAMFVAIIVFVIWTAVTLGAALIFMWAWNLFMPILWCAAPHITFIQAIAAGILLSVVKGLFSITINKGGDQ